MANVLHTAKTEISIGGMFAMLRCHISIFHFIFSECRSYRTLSEYDRAQGYRGVIKCDRSLPTAWYRFTGRAGNMMPSSCVAPGHLDQS